MTPHRPLPKDREAGFTLVELLVVLVILALLAALVGPRVVGYMGQSRVKTAKIQIASYQTALELYHLDMGRYPAQSEGLDALTNAPPSSGGWNGPYLNKAVAADPWGNAYAYVAAPDGATYRLSSYGADGKEGGEGDNADITP
ncbi:type II secretion system major pseudopilin GspG [Paragemmobacter straminiformis]|uniref:Type II secretion system core protein G n=1 Tax=Paragemmobacter straminiformis TaxID=2045119 RepID=A0A842I916_9RHOB|nr:type II secretion system major pseudopilin GspG [Gemmobacter straminiformis]MBC2836542.1 type II secretion system major pseudopilin GspG [Gemmobacter straminiformis]